MKKLLNALLVVCLCCGVLVGCGKKEEDKEPSRKDWSNEDFSFYDEDGEEAYFLTSENNWLNLNDLNSEDGEEYRAFCGTKIGDRATTALENRDLSGFYYEVTSGYLRSTSDEEKAYNEQFHKKYKNASEAVEHSGEIYESSLFDENAELFLCAHFYENDAGELVKYEMDEEGNVTEEIKNAKNYSIYIYIKDEKISDISLELKDFSDM